LQDNALASIQTHDPERGSRCKEQCVRNPNHRQLHGHQLAYWKINFVMHSMERSTFREDYSRSASQEIPSLRCNPKVHYRLQRSPPLVPILNQTHPVHNFPPYFPNMNCNIVLTFTPWSSEWSLPFRS